MKVFAVYFALFLGSMSALPTEEVQDVTGQRQQRIISGIIIDVIEDYIQTIVEVGLDPVVIQHADLDYALPVPTIFNMEGHVKDLLFRGLSSVIINDLNVSIINPLRPRVTFNVTLREILLNVVDSEVVAHLFDAILQARYSGRLVLQDIVVTGNVRLLVRLTGYSIDEMDITFNLGRIDSQLNLHLQDKDYSHALNTFLGETIPLTLQNYEDDINTLISIVAKEIVEAIL